jgi:hypothetical protein
MRVSPDAALAALLRDVHEAQSLLHTAFSASLTLATVYAFASFWSLALAQNTSNTRLAKVGGSGMVGR